MCTMMMLVRRRTVVAPRSNRMARSITGTARPRRLITPRMNGGIIGTTVRFRYSRISSTWKMSSAYASSFSVNVRYRPEPVRAVEVITSLTADHSPRVTAVAPIRS